MEKGGWNVVGSEEEAWEEVHLREDPLPGPRDRRVAQLQEAGQRVLCIIRCPPANALIIEIQMEKMSDRSKKKPFCGRVVEYLDPGRRPETLPVPLELQSAFTNAALGVAPVTDGPA